MSKSFKTEVLYGFHPVCEALNAGKRSFYEFYTVKSKASKRLEKILSRAESSMIPVKKITPSQFHSLVGTEQHQGIGAMVSMYPLAEFSDIVGRSKAAGGNFFLLLLDNIVDPHNLGAIIRTALCAGIDGIIIPKDRSAPPTPAVSRASAGALEHISLAMVTNMANTINALKKKGLWVAGLDQCADRSIFDSDLTGSMAIIIGGEDKGIRPLVKKHCDFLISIPQKVPFNSLNASTAGAIAMYEAVRQRRKKSETD